MPAPNVDKLSEADATKEHARVALLEAGDWSYNAGTGTATDSQPGRLLSVTVIAPTATGATFTVSDGLAITVPAGAFFTFNPKGLTTGSVVITDAASWVVERAL